jgi:hypothetical protein
MRSVELALAVLMQRHFGVTAVELFTDRGAARRYGDADEAAWPTAGEGTTEQADSPARD